jgi:hypothetical protein
MGSTSDNLAFRSDLISVRRKHTRYGEQRFASDIVTAMTKLDLFRESEAERIAAMQTTDVDDVHAESLLLRAYERGIIPAPALPNAIREWRDPSHEEFTPRTYFSLMNAVTTALGEKARKNPERYAVTTVRLNALFTEEGRFALSVN